MIVGSRYQQLRRGQTQVLQANTDATPVELACFEGFAELLLQAADKLAQEWAFEESRTAPLLLIRRLIDDFEAARILALHGLYDMAFMPLRDAVEACLLVRFFVAKPERGLRWARSAKEYSVKVVIAELKTNAPPEGHLWDPLSYLAHANCLPTVMAMKDTDVEPLRVRSFLAGGRADPRHLELVMHALLGEMFCALDALRDACGIVMGEQFSEWWIGACANAQKVSAVLSQYDAPNQRDRMALKEEQLMQSLRRRMNIYPIGDTADSG